MLTGFISLGWYGKLIADCAVHTYIHTYSFHFIHPFCARLHLDMKLVRRENIQHKTFTNKCVKINIRLYSVSNREEKLFFDANYSLK